MLDYEHWSWVEPHKSVTFGSRLVHIGVLHFAMRNSILTLILNFAWQSASLLCVHSNGCQPETKFSPLMWLRTKNVSVQCGVPYIKNFSENINSLPVRLVHTDNSDTVDDFELEIRSGSSGVESNLVSNAT